MTEITNDGIDSIEVMILSVMLSSGGVGFDDVAVGVVDIVMV